MERAEELPRHRLITRKAWRRRSSTRRLLRPYEASLEGDPRVPPRGRWLPEAAREGAAAAGVRRGRGDGHARGWEVWGRGRLADGGGGGDHGDETRTGFGRLGIGILNWGFFVRLGGVLNFFFSFGCSNIFF